MQSTKQKITIGYILLLAILFFSLVFVYHEMEKLSNADDIQNLETDSLLLLLHEKDQNTIQMLRILSETNDNLLSTSEVEEIISEQDSIVNKQRIQNRVITKRDTLITKPKNKGFFKRLAEAFSPSQKDTALLVNTSLEFITDTILEPSYSKDSLQYKIREASQERRSQRRKVIKKNSANYQRLNSELTGRMDSLIKRYEEEMVLRTLRDAELQQSVRMRSAQTISSIAVGAVLLSAFFLILILRDITKSNRYRKQLEDANKLAKDLLDAREKLMLAITHDFKAPLGSIMGYTELLSRLTDDERQRFYLENMKSSSGHLLKLVNDLLDFHRLDLNKAEVNSISFNPSQLFEEIAVSFQPLTAAKGLILQCKVDPILNGRYISDPLRIHQIVNNLLSNAVKFTQKGGVTLTVYYETSKMIIKVADTGKGMAEEDKERIFQEFTRLSGAQGEEGFGLGLSIVSKLVHLLEGIIDVESTLGEGSCFTVVLPLFPIKDATGEVLNIEQKNSEKKILKKENIPSSANNLRVLLIDDDKIQLDLTAAMLKQQGMSAVCCTELDELTEQLQTSVFDILLTDIQMPAINGFDLLNLLRASNIRQARTIPVVAVTARSEMDDRALREHGFAGCLHKPFAIKELIAVISGEQSVMGNEQVVHSSSATCHSVSFSALTAFSEGDIDAGNAIIQSFIEETRKNISRMEQYLESHDVDGIAGIAHKILPLFTLLNVSEAVPLLSWLEARRGCAFNHEIEQVTVKVVTVAQQVVKAAEGHQFVP